MAVTNDRELEAWLEEQSQETCTAIAHRAAMRVLPFALDLDGFDGAEDLALMTVRCSLTSGVAAVWPTPDVKDEVKKAALSAARSARSARSAFSAARSAESALSASARSAESAASALSASASARSAAASAASAFSAADSAASAASAARSATYADTEIEVDRLMRVAISVPDLVKDLHAEVASNGRSALEAGGPWAFWAEWYARAMKGEPLDWTLQEKIALIPDDVWEEGVGAVAEAIAGIEAAFWAERLPQAEEVVATNDGLFDVRPSVTADDSLVERIFKQTTFVLDLALTTNCGFNEMCVGYKLIRHTLDNCRDDPNAIEQNLRMARNVISEKVATEAYDNHDALKALVDSLSQHALELRGQHSEVRAAYEVRVQQTLRETDDETKIAVAKAMREFQQEKAVGRLHQETGLDAEVVETNGAVEAQASAIQRTGGRAAVARGLERASKAAKDVDASGGYKGARIGTTGYTIVDILIKFFGG